MVKLLKFTHLFARAYNADFDGDQMAVHVPLSEKSQEECKSLFFRPKIFFLLLMVVRYCSIARYGSWIALYDQRCVIMHWVKELFLLS